AGAVQVEGVVHGVVGVHLVDQCDLDPVAFGELPVDSGVGRAGGPVDQLPPHVGRGGEPVDGDHVVFPFDAPAITVAVVSAMVVAAVGVWRGLLAPGRLGGKRGDEQFHAALGAAAGLVAGDVRVHRAGVAGGRGGGEQLHPAFRAAAWLLAGDFRVHRAGVQNWPFPGCADVV